MIKCPCCLSDLVVTHQDRYETLTEHVEGREPSLKDGYQCPNEKCKAYEMNGVWIEEGDFWIKEPPAGMNFSEAEAEVERHSFTGKTNAINSFSDGYERYREDKEKRTITLNLYWFIVQFVPKYERVNGTYEWKRTGVWKRSIMKRTDGRYLHYMTFWDIYYFELGNYKNSIHKALAGNRDDIEVILKMARNEGLRRKRDKRFWWMIARYFICWIYNRESTKTIIRREKLKEMRKMFEQEGLMQGRLLSGSKSLYRERHPENLVCFNANVFTREGKIWYGDLDITLESEKLERIAQELGEKLYVLREMDGRFENEDISEVEIMQKAVYSTNG